MLAGRLSVIEADERMVGDVPVNFILSSFSSEIVHFDSGLTVTLPGASLYLIGPRSVIRGITCFPQMINVITAIVEK